MATKELYEQLKFEEGLRLHAYRCSEGFLTIGIGHNLDASPLFNDKRIPMTITEAFAQELFEHDIALMIAELKHAAPWVYSLDEVRRDALYNMAFQMGVEGLLAFKNSLKCLQLGAYRQCATSLLKSKWAKQTPKRAVRVSRQIVTGKYY